MIKYYFGKFLCLLGLPLWRTAYNTERFNDFTKLKLSEKLGAKLTMEGLSLADPEGIIYDQIMKDSK